MTQDWSSQPSRSPVTQPAWFSGKHAPSVAWDSGHKANTLGEQSLPKPPAPFPGVFPEVPSVFAACTCRSAPPRSLSCSFTSLHIYSRWAPAEGLCKEMNPLPGAGMFSSDFPGPGAVPWGGSCHPRRLWTITICLFSVCSSLCTPVTRWQEPRP